MSASVHAGIHPPRADTPQEQTHPQRADTPPRADTSHSRHTPQEQTPPKSRHPPRADIPRRADTPQDQIPPKSRNPQDRTPPKSRQTPPQEQTPPRIRSTSGRYTSYWNAFLFLYFFHIFLKGYGCHDYEIEMYCKHKKNDCDKPRWWEELKLNCAETCGWCAKTESEDPRVESGMTLMA